MALFKHRVTTASIPDGLMECDVELTKGMIVARKLVDGKYKIVLPESAKEVYGFVTLREDEAVYKASHYDAIPAGKKAVVYTLVKDHEWRTDQFEGELVVGDKVAAKTNGFESNFISLFFTKSLFVFAIMFFQVFFDHHL